MQAEWASSDLARSLLDDKERSTIGPLTVWRVCTRLFEKSPFAIVSPALGLEYEHGGLWAEE